MCVIVYECLYMDERLNFKSQCHITWMVLSHSFGESSMIFYSSNQVMVRFKV